MGNLEDTPPPPTPSNPNDIHEQNEIYETSTILGNNDMYENSNGMIKWWSQNSDTKLTEYGAKGFDLQEYMLKLDKEKKDCIL